MSRLVSLDGAVAGFCMDGSYIDCMCGRELLRVRKDSGEVVYRRAVFEKDGLSRKLTAHGGELFAYDFCMFYIFSRDGYELLGRWRLGEDLRSDICGMAADEDTAYCSIRGGKLAAIDRRSHRMKERQVSGSSMWSLMPYGGHLLCGTVDGRLLRLDKASLDTERELTLGKKNIASLFTDGHALYAAGQDGKLFKIGLHELETERTAKKAHRKMFRIIGTYRDMLATVSYPCSEIAFWDRDTLEKLRVLEVPLELSGQARIDGDRLYICSRNIPGIDVLRLDQA